jgi:hypothetical protein
LNALVDLAALPTISLKMFETPHFRRLMSVLNPACPNPSANTVRKRLIEKSVAISKSIGEDLRELRGYLTAVIDIWTNSAMLHSYIGIKLHAIQGSQIVSYCIGLEELIRRHTAADIKNCVLKKLREFDIDLKDIFAFVTDNGANIVKAFHLEKG